MSAIGIDYDTTRVTMAFCSEEKWVIREVPTKSYCLIWEFADHARHNGVTHAALERPFLGRWTNEKTGETKSNPQTHFQLARVYGRIEVLCEMAGLVVKAISASDWQEAMLTPQHSKLGGRTQRKKLSRMVAKELGAEVEKNHHKADAVCMAELLSKRLRLERAEV